MSIPRIAVVGAGVLGLSTVWELRRRYKVLVDLYSDAMFSRKICSFRKGAFLDPFLAEGENIPRWTATTYERYVELAPHCPFVMKRALRVYEESHKPRPVWLASMPAEANVRDLDVSPLPAGFVGGFALDTWVIDQERLLLWLLSESLQPGLEIFPERVKALEDLAHYDAVVNASGMGAKELGFPEMLPIRGQWVLFDGDLSHTKYGNGVYFLPEPETKHLAYLVAGDGWTLVGGTSQRGDLDLSPRVEDERAFLESSAELVPEITSMSVVSRGVQLRPGRSSTEVICGQLSDGTPCIHSVGAGGSGLSIWAGMAEDAVSGIAEALSL